MIKIEAITDSKARVVIGGSEDNIRLEIRALLDAITEDPLSEIFTEELDNCLKERK